MNQEIIGVVWGLIGVLIGCVLTYLWSVQKIAVLSERLAQAAELKAHKKEIPPLFVRVEPGFQQLGTSGFLTKKSKFELGYQYQLFAHGIPCLEPHITVVESREESIVDEKAVERLKTYAYEAAQMAISSQVKGAGSLISVVKGIGGKGGSAMGRDIASGRLWAG